jgi:hypothetical protein
MFFGLTLTALVFFAVWVNTFVSFDFLTLLLFAIVYSPSDLFHLNVIRKSFFAECHVDIKFGVFDCGGFAYMFVRCFDFFVGPSKYFCQRFVGLVPHVPCFGPHGYSLGWLPSTA